MVGLFVAVISWCVCLIVQHGDTGKDDDDDDDDDNDDVIFVDIEQHPASVAEDVKPAPAIDQVDNV